MRAFVVAFLTDWGWVGMAVSRRGLAALTLPASTREEALEPLLRRGKAERLPSHPLWLAFQEKLRRYFRGSPVAFREPLDLEGATPFQRRVWEEVRAIPWGQTLSYGEVARRLGCPKAARAVGRALAANPIPIVIPCHRVVGSGGNLGGFGGGLEMKKRLLTLEGSWPLSSPCCSSPKPLPENKSLQEENHAHRN